MEISQLRHFLEVARREHVTKSAEALHIAQPALTQSVHRLEKELGVPLFAAQGRNIRLTPYGRYFYEKLAPVMASLDELPGLLKTMAKLEDATVHLNILAASALVTRAVIEYQKIDSGLRVTLAQNDQNALYDICVTTKFPNREAGTEHDSVYVCTETIYLAVPNIGPFRGKGSVRLRDVADAGFISLTGSKQLRAICDTYCASAGIRPNIIFESDSPEAVKNMIAANMGVGFWPAFSWGKLRTDKVRLLEIEEPVCSRDILIQYRKNKRDNAKAEAFYQYLVRRFRRAQK